MGDASFFYLLFFTMLTLSMAAENGAGVWPMRGLIVKIFSIYPLQIEGPFQWILVEVVYPDGTFCYVVPTEWLYVLPPECIFNAGYGIIDWIDLIIMWSIIIYDNIYIYSKRRLFN